MAALAPEQQPVAEQVLRGGIPAVRTAIHLERERAAAEGRAAPNSDALLAMAEAILPKLKAADWRDRAEAAAKAPTDITLRDLRAVVTGADVARDEESRVLAVTLRDALEQRVSALRTEWTNEIVHHLDEGRAVRALRLSGRPPEPSTKLPDELVTRLTETASQAMAPDAPPDRWVSLLEAVASSPVRRSVHPVGLPGKPSAELLRAAHQHSARIPALVPMLGISIPPPPPRRPAPPTATSSPNASRRSASAPDGQSSPSAPDESSEELGEATVESSAEPVEAGVDPVEASGEPVEANPEPTESIEVPSEGPGATEEVSNAGGDEGATEMLGEGIPAD
jgi:hypothetical protein